MAEKKKNQLHQLLAVEPDLRSRAAKITQETYTMFSKKADHFDGLQKTYQPYEETGAKEPDASKEIVTTVDEKLKHTFGAIGQALDATVQKELTNSSNTVKAELAIKDQVFGEFSGTALLALEQHLAKVRDLCDAIPTFDMAKTWEEDKQAGKKGIFRTGELKTYKTAKLSEPLILHGPTKEHPAQVQVVNVDKQVGQWSTVHTTGRISPAQKSYLLARIDALIRATKKARSKANQAEVLEVRVSKKIFDFIMG